MATVLLVDDEPGVRQVLQAFLELEGLSVIEAGDGEEALAIALSTAIDLVVTDIMMPRMDGVGLLREIRTRLGPSLPVVVISGHHDARLPADLADSSTRFMTKPVTLNGFCGMVRDLLASSRSAP
ncbi:MAG: response regulator [Armatimonadetes bacterium]|nr:response regulator [Armatimonadota bacterium]